MLDKNKLPVNPKQAKKILIINLGGIGDFLLSYPALKSLRDYYANGKIVFLGVSRTLEAAADYGLFDEVVRFDFGLRKMIPLLFSLRKKRFDLAINMRSISSWQGAFKMLLFFSVIAPACSAGRNTSKMGFFFNIQVPEEKIGDTPEYEYDLKMARALGAGGEFFIPKINYSDSDLRYVKNLLFRQGMREGDIIVGVNPGAPNQAKRWPKEKFLEMLEIICSKMNCRVVLSGTKDETRISEWIANNCRYSPINISGMTSFRQLSAFISCCNVFVSNDTGPMHIAAIEGIPLVAIFAGGFLSRFDPRNISKKAIVFRKDVPCSPCSRVNCRAMRCLKDITALDVAHAVMSLAQ